MQMHEEASQKCQELHKVMLPFFTAFVASFFIPFSFRVQGTGHSLILAAAPPPPPVNNNLMPSLRDLRPDLVASSGWKTAIDSGISLATGPDLILLSCSAFFSPLFMPPRRPKKARLDFRGGFWAFCAQQGEAASLRSLLKSSARGQALAHVVKAEGLLHSPLLRVRPSDIPESAGLEVALPVEDGSTFPRHLHHDRKWHP